MKQIKFLDYETALEAKNNGFNPLTTTYFYEECYGKNTFISDGIENPSHTYFNNKTGDIKQVKWYPNKHKSNAFVATVSEDIYKKWLNLKNKQNV